MLLEILSGLRAADNSRSGGQYSLADFAKPFLVDRSKLNNFMDPKLEWKYPSKAARCAADLSLRCISSNPKDRPSMKEVVEILEQVADIKRIPKESKPKLPSQNQHRGLGPVHPRSPLTPGHRRGNGT